MMGTQFVDFVEENNQAEISKYRLRDYEALEKKNVYS